MGSWVLGFLDRHPSLYCGEKRELSARRVVGWISIPLNAPEGASGDRIMHDTNWITKAPFRAPRGIENDPQQGVSMEYPVCAFVTVGVPVQESTSGYSKL